MTHEPAGVYRPQLSVDGKFTIIPNDWIRNSGLSASANYLLIYLVSHEIGYEIKFEQIMRETGLGVKALRTAMAELKEAGWLFTDRTKKANGQLGSYRYSIKEPTRVPQSTVAQATVAQATMAEGTHIKNTNTTENKDLENKELVNAPQESEKALFDEFYKTYPRKRQPGDARKAFSSALHRATFEEIMAGCIRFANDPYLPAENYIPYPASWLRADSWLDGPLPPDPKRQKQIEKEQNERKIEEWLNAQDGN